MGRKSGSLNWATLATWPNTRVYDHFIQRKYDPHHAFNALRKLRSEYRDDGTRYPAPIHIPRDFYTREDTPVDPFQAEHDGGMAARAFEAPVEVCVVNQESPVTEVEEKMEGSNASKVLAQLIAPELVSMLETRLAAAIATLAPQTRTIVVRDQLETELKGTTHEATAKVLQLANQGLNVMMVGPAGCGKTMLAQKVAEALGRTCTIISCSAGMSESALLGRLLPIGEGGKFAYVESPFMRAYREGGVILLDEMDAADPNLLLVINAALANGGLTVEARAASHEDTYVARHADTIVLAAANTYGTGADTQYVGRGALDASTLDRFYRVAIDYDRALESTLGSADNVKWVQTIRAEARSNKLRRVVSSRMIVALERAAAAGIDRTEARRDVLNGWTAEELRKVGG